MQNIASYPLATDGAIQEWLSCGPYTSPIAGALRRTIDATGTPFGHGKRWTLNYWAFEPEVATLKSSVYRALEDTSLRYRVPPVLYGEAMASLRWESAESQEDDVVDLSLFNFSPMLMRGWQYALVDAPETLNVSAELITIGPARLWVNSELVEHFHHAFNYVAVQCVQVHLRLRPGHNEVFIQGDMLGWREARLTLDLERGRVLTPESIHHVDYQRP